jgi:cytochrome c oxidase assembly protein subunit 11
MTAPSKRRRNGTTVVLLVSVVAGMAGLAFASVPLYRLFCQATGFGGTTQRAAAAPSEISGPVMTVRFDAETAPDLPWEFRPLTRAVRVRPGEPTEVFYRATNRSAAATTGTATFNVTPTKSGIYFDKLQCFCFTEQLLGPGESRDMGVSFFVDPDLVQDPGTRDVRTITLSYTMFRKPDSDKPAQPSAAAGPRGSTAAVN